MLVRPFDPSRGGAPLASPELRLDDWTDHQLRLAYYDFTLRGMGEYEIVEAALTEWTRRGVLTSGDMRLWLDALRWREMGNLLPGWHTDGPHGELSGQESDYSRFVAWRHAA